MDYAKNNNITTSENFNYIFQKEFFFELGFLFLNIWTFLLSCFYCYWIFKIMARKIWFAKFFWTILNYNLQFVIKNLIKKCDRNVETCLLV